MPILLYGLGALCVVAGAFFAWLGLPDRDFSFGNTLILIGTLSAVGGLILVGLGAVVSRLGQLIELGIGHPATQPRRPVEGFEAPAGQRPPSGRIPFPPKPKIETRPAPVIMPAEPPPRAEPVAAATPTLPNPDEPPAEITEEVSLSPPQPIAESPILREHHEEPVTETEPQEGFDKEWPAPTPPPERRSLFGFGRTERKTEEPPPPPLEEMPPEPEAPILPAAAETVPEPEPEPESVAEPVPEKPRDVAILKSGVVDGMGYTLYVDGSIEAELPQGTLRFASINELREHLEQNT